MLVYVWVYTKTSAYGTILVKTKDSGQESKYISLGKNEALYSIIIHTKRRHIIGYTYVEDRNLLNQGQNLIYMVI